MLYPATIVSFSCGSVHTQVSCFNSILLFCLSFVPVFVFSACCVYCIFTYIYIYDDYADYYINYYNLLTLEISIHLIFLAV